MSYAIINNEVCLKQEISTCACTCGRDVLV